MLITLIIIIYFSSTPDLELLLKFAELGLLVMGLPMKSGLLKLNFNQWDFA